MSDQVVEGTLEEPQDVLPAEPEGKGLDPASLGLELPDDHDEATQMLVAEIAQSRTEATTYLDDLKRVAADFDNYRKRTVRDQASSHQRAVERVVTSLLPVLDTFDAALANQPEDTDDQVFEGMVNTRDQLLAALGAEGLEVIPAVGETFDPEVHEPVGAPAGSGELVVGQELRRGYTLTGKVVRAALVVLEIKE